MSYVDEGVSGVSWAEPVNRRKDLFQYESDSLGTTRLVTDLNVAYIRTAEGWFGFMGYGGDDPAPPVYLSAIDRLAALLDEDG